MNRLSTFANPSPRGLPTARMHMLTRSIGATFLLGFCPDSVLSHGIQLTGRSFGTAYLIEASHEGFDSVAGTSVKVYTPGASTLYQRGSTDPQGRFVFIPDRPGKWRVSVSDVHGHGREAMFEISDELLANKEDDVVRQAGTVQWAMVLRILSHIGRLLVGLTSIIVVTWFTAQWLEARRAAEEGS